MFHPRHHLRALEHLRMAYGDTIAESELERLAAHCLESTAMFAVEALCLPRLITASTWPRYIRCTNESELIRTMLSGSGCILVTGHYGPFELPGHFLAALGFHAVAVMRPLDNVYLNRYLVHTRKMHGLSLIDKKGAMKSAERVLKEGAALGFVGDQDAGRKGQFVDFFGQSASTYKSIGLLAMSTGRPIAVGYARRIGDRAQYEIGIERMIHPQDWEQQDDPLLWITQAYTQAIENIVRKDPAQYLWIHRRWKSKPRNRTSKNSSETNLLEESQPAVTPSKQEESGGSIG